MFDFEMVFEMFDDSMGNTVMVVVQVVAVLYATGVLFSWLRRILGEDLEPVPVAEINSLRNAVDQPLADCPWCGFPFRPSPHQGVCDSCAKAALEEAD